VAKKGTANSTGTFWIFHEMPMNDENGFHEHRYEMVITISQDVVFFAAETPRTNTQAGHSVKRKDGSSLFVRCNGA
jgi:hypothetical protein